MLRRYLIQKYLNYHSEEDIKEVIGHSSLAYVKGAVIAIVLLFFLYLAYALLNHFNPMEYWKWIFAILGMIVLFKWIIDFFDMYLDCIVLTQESLTLFLREGILEYKTEIFFRNKVSSLSWKQKGLLDKLFLQGDLLLTLEHDLDVTFENVYLPKKWIGKISLLKQKFLDQKKLNLERDLAEDQDRFEILIEAMGEVVKDYLTGKEGH